MEIVYAALLYSERKEPGSERNDGAIFDPSEIFNDCEEMETEKENFNCLPWRPITNE